jgi:hypothetical protein
MDDLEAISPEDSSFGGLAEGPLAKSVTAGRPPRFSRRTKIGAAALAVAMVGAGGWVAATAGGSGHSTVRLQSAAATSSSSGSTAPAGRSAKRTGLFGHGVAGKVTGTPTSASFVVIRLSPRTPKAAAGTSTPAANSSTPVTVNVTASTTYSELQASTGLVIGLAPGTPITATGSRNTNGSLQASSVSVRSAHRSPAKTPSSRQPAQPGGTAATARQARFAVGTVAADSPSGVITITTPGGTTETIDTSASTKELRDVVTTSANVVNGVEVIVQAQRQTTSSRRGPITATHVTIIPAGLTGSGFARFGGGFGLHRGAFPHRAQAHSPTTTGPPTTTPSAA